MNLVALLPKDRSQLGTLQAWQNGSLVQSFPVYGKADNATAAANKNPTRNPLKPFGDTPTGTWTVRVGIIMKDADTYGPAKVFMLWPTGGQARASYGAKNRRNGIWIHGGKLNPAGGLRPTYGCLRVHNEDMARLHELSLQYGPIEMLETKEV